ncbi:MAG: Lin0512 family protein [Paracoccaceae bacterium]|jgi:uncharacterized protein (TIGR02058 family)|nr:Lin0512 family protein [Paracoccaceae bacterium]
MTDQRFIIEMGMGNDLHGQDYTKAACRAVDNALHGSTLAILHAVPSAKNELRVKVTIGVQDPSAIDVAQVLKMLPVGRIEIEVKHGGLNVDDAVIAQAAIEAFLPYQGN